MTDHRQSKLLPLITALAIALALLLFLFDSSSGQGGKLVWLLAVGGVLAIAISTRLALRHEAALVTRLTHAESTLEALGEAVIRLDGQGRIEYLNPAARRLLETEGAELPETINIVDHASRQALLPTLLAEKTDHQAVALPAGARLIAPLGIEFEVAGSCLTMRYADGQLQAAVLLLRDITEEQEWIRSQPDLWDRDPLTALPGRSFMLKRLTRMLERERAGDRPISYIQVAIDGIDQVYEGAGSRAGDILVRNLTTLLRAQIRDTDLLARMDDATFGILLTLCPDEVNDRILARIRDNLATSVFSWDGKAYAIVGRTGHVCIPPFQGCVDDLFAAAGKYE